MEPFETFEHAGVTVEIHQDTEAGDPFEQYEQLAELVWTDREHAYKNVGGRVSIDHEHYLDPDGFRNVADMQRYLTLMDGYLVAIPFHLADYGSGGYRATLYRDHYPDENRLSGFLVVSEANREKVGAPLDGLEDNAIADWKMWKAWVEGEVFGFRVAPGASDEEACWSFYGELDYVRKEAREEAEAIAEERARLRALPWLPTFGKPIERSAPC